MSPETCNTNGLVLRERRARLGLPGGPTVSMTLAHVLAIKTLVEGSRIRLPIRLCCIKGTPRLAEHGTILIRRGGALGDLTTDRFGSVTTPQRPE